MITDMTTAARSVSMLLAGERLVAVDVGAARGILPHWTPLATTARLYLFEPDVDAIPRIRKQLDSLHAADARVLAYGLSEVGGPHTLHRLAVRSGSSLLKLNLPGALDHTESSWVFPQSEVVVDTRTLASVLDEENEPLVHMIKLDTQGTELPILRGLGARVDGLVSLELEVGTFDTYEGGSKLADVLAFAEAHGLELFDVTPKRYPLVRSGEPGFYEKLFGTYRRAPSIGHRLVELDAMFFRRRDRVLASGDAGCVRRLLVAYACYGRFAHAHRLAELATEAKLFSQDDMRRIEASLVAWHRSAYRERVVVDVAEKLVSKLGERLAPARQTTGGR